MPSLIKASHHTRPVQTVAAATAARLPRVTPRDGRRPQINLPSALPFCRRSGSSGPRERRRNERNGSLMNPFLSADQRRPSRRRSDTRCDLCTRGGVIADRRPRRNVFPARLGGRVATRAEWSRDALCGIKVALLPR